MELKEILKQHLQEASNVLNNFLTNDEYLNSVTEAAETIISALKDGKKVISAGNGGSMCDAIHFAEELTGRWRGDRKAIPAISISDPAHITCVGNDYGFEQIFSRYLQGVGNPGDVFFGISTSGNSKNILEACFEAKKRDMKVVILTSDKNGPLQAGYGHFVDNLIKTPPNQYADRIQEIHIKIIHSLIDMIEQNLEL
jgi:D-sedoheptulose 7-phosphate isomerase